MSGPEGWATDQFPAARGSRFPVRGLTLRTPIGSPGPVCGSRSRLISISLEGSVAVGSSLSLKWRTQTIGPKSIPSQEEAPPPEIAQGPPPEILDRLARVPFIHLARGTLSLTETTGISGPAIYSLRLRDDNGEILCEEEDTDFDTIVVELALAISRR